MNERNGQLRNHHSRAVLGIPNVLVLKPVHVHVKPVVGIDAHVSDEKTCNEPSLPLSLEYSRDCIVFGT